MVDAVWAKLHNRVEYSCQHNLVLLYSAMNIKTYIHARRNFAEFFCITWNYNALREFLPHFEYTDGLQCYGGAPLGLICQISKERKRKSWFVALHGVASG